LDGSIHSIKKNAEAFFVASKEIGLEVNAEKTKYMTVYWVQYAGKSQHKISNILWNCEIFQIFGNNPNKSSIHWSRN
jgi:hypothetical protein